MRKLFTLFGAVTKIGIVLSIIIFPTMAFAQISAPPTISVVVTLSTTPPFTFGATSNLILTVTNMLSPSVATTTVPYTTKFTLNGVSSSNADTITLIPGVSNLATSVATTVTLPITVFKVGTLPAGVTYSTTSGVLTLPTILVLDGGATSVYTIPVTFLAAVP